jgi:hypothetical protein
MDLVREYITVLLSSGGFSTLTLGDVLHQACDQMKREESRVRGMKRPRAEGEHVADAAPAPVVYPDPRLYPSASAILGLK